ncbi:MAG: carboxypeptidase regulatory-like domain-containing protein [Planctomycetes bacterium]|nr:carboxypeptidase regulatory-like domain-containing protein [Planctomycetota bacterium]
MKRLWFCLALLLWIPGLSYAQGFNLGKGVGSSIGQATLGLTNGSKAASDIKLTTGNFSISGKATGKNNKPIQGVLMTISGDVNTSASTDRKGKYVFSPLDSGDYTITPTLEGYTFTPKSRDVTITTRNKKNVNFRGKRVLKSSPLKNDAPRLSSLSVITPAAEAVGWPYGEPDADGYYTVNGYKMRLYDDSDNVITDMPTSYASVVKIEIKVEESYADGSVNGSIFANTSFSAGGLSYPLVFNGTLDLTMDSDEFGTLSGTVEIQDCTLDSGATFFSSGSMDVETEGSLTADGFEVTHSTSGTLNVTDSTFQGTLSLTYNVTGAPVEIGDTVDMTLTINADGSGSYSSDDQYVGSGTF